MKLGLYKNNKTGTVYQVIGVAINANNKGPSGEAQVIYHPQGQYWNLFYREPGEFVVKFTFLGDAE